VTVTLAADGEIGVTDAMNNTRVLKSEGRKITFRTIPRPLYDRGSGHRDRAGWEPDHADAQPAPGAVLVADLGDGSWTYTSTPDTIYASNNTDTARYLGRFSSAVVADPQRGKVLASRLEPQAKVHALMPWYNTLTPRTPIELKGAPSAIGLWVKGASDWGRVIYSLRDARGERWISVGTKDQWNCDDVHSWSSFNFDGWRYLRFEMPGHAGYDSYRKPGTTCGARRALRQAQGRRAHGTGSWICH